MRKYTLLFILLLSALNVARGQTPYTYRYWMDNNAAGVKTGTASGEKSFDIDISQLPSGLHALHLQAMNNKGVLSAVHTQFFVKLADNKNVTAQYWFDNDASTLHTVETMSSTIDINASELEPGLHAIHFQTIGADGIPSAVRTEYLYIKALLVAKIWIDDNIDDTKTYALNGDPIVIDVRKLAVGMHTLTATLIYSDGQTIGTQTVEFEVLPRMKTITLTAELMAFSCDEDLDFTGTEGLRAYTAAGFNKKSSEVSMFRVLDVPANTGLLLRGEIGTYEVLCQPSDSYYANLLVATLEDTPLSSEADGYANYVLMMENEKAGFTMAADGSMSAAESAYLRIPSNGTPNASRLKILFDTVPGDMDDDGRITKADIVGITNVIAKGGTQMQHIAADVNGDGRVNVADIILLLQKVARTE